MRNGARPFETSTCTILPAGTVVRFSAGSSVKKVNVPVVPIISGVPMPESESASHSAGGKFAGMRITFEGMPWSSRICQNVRPTRDVVTLPEESGIR
jgi:hypothetical protein